MEITAAALFPEKQEAPIPNTGSAQDIAAIKKVIDQYADYITNYDLKEAERIWQDALRRAKQKPQIYGMLRFGRLVSGENGLFTVVYPKATGAAYVKMFSIKEKNEEVAAYLTAAAGYPCTFRAAIEGTVQESDKAVLAAQKEAKQQAENNLNKVFEMFGRENVRVSDE